MIVFEPQLSNEYVMLWVHSYLGCIRSEWLLTVLCIECGKNFDNEAIFEFIFDSSVWNNYVGVTSTLALID
jgi:hypothetical protein